MIWFGKDKDGRRNIYTATTPLFAILPLLAIAIAILLAALRSCTGG